MNLRIVALLTLSACPVQRPDGPNDAFTGVWATPESSGVVVYFPDAGDDLAWSPLNLPLLDGGLRLTHNCRDFFVDVGGRTFSRPGVAPAGSAGVDDGGLRLVWSRSALTKVALAIEPDAGASEFRISGSLTDNLLTIRSEWLNGEEVVSTSDLPLEVSKLDACP